LLFRSVSSSTNQSYLENIKAKNRDKEYLEAIIRINPKNFHEAYVTSPVRIHLNNVHINLLLYYHDL
jgi:hypothetical protein